MEVCGHFREMEDDEYSQCPDGPSLVEDEEGVRFLAVEILESAGYRVLQAKDGETALLAAASHDGTIELLVTDMVMPGLSGTKLAESLEASRPSAKVLFMTGYTEETVPTQGPEHAGRSLIDKPFTSEGLLRAVRAVLDEVEAGG